VHYVIPGGGISPDHDRWISCKPGFFLPVRVLFPLYFDGCFWMLSETVSGKASFCSSVSSNPLPMPEPSSVISNPLRDADWVVLRQAPRSEAHVKCWNIWDAIYAPRRHLQPTPRFAGKQSGHVSMEGLPA